MSIHRYPSHPWRPWRSWRLNLFGAIGCFAFSCAFQLAAKGQEHPLDLSRPACGKVCMLVCETKTLTAIGYGNECKQICLPGPSRAGSKHCDACYGECPGNPGQCCQESAPKCEFCWRDWFACGCAKPRSVKVLTKWQAEKKVCSYHWTVVDAACCDCVGRRDGPAVDLSLGIARSETSHSYYKSAPEGAEVGDVLPVTEDEWVHLTAAMTPDPQKATSQIANNARAREEGDASESPARPAKPSLAERLERVFN